MLEIYKTLLEEVEEKNVEKKSKFICSMKSVQTEEDALAYILSIKKKYYDANHHCSAFIVGFSEGTIERSNDDREPTGTAGKPILEVIKGAELKNIVVVVTRYFGGVLLGTGGLIKAYTESVKSALEKSILYEKVLCEKLKIETDYSALPKIEYEILQMKQKIYDIIYSDKVTMILLVKYSLVDTIKNTIINLTNGQSQILSEGFYYVATIKNQVLLEIA